MFAVHCKDKPGAQQVRLDNRPAHVEFLKTNVDKIVLAGPLLTEDRTGMIGSLLVLNFTDRAEVEAFLAADPYAKAGLFESVAVQPFKKVFP